ncbi:cupin domain-containing protein [Nitrobacter sp. NHB1]|uniref:cupin domain-containing protein n=1 Tax=Nitrobacter sp. NHB1 TaxID=3119830 RepID=UPI002FFE9A31
MRRHSSLRPAAEAQATPMICGFFSCDVRPFNPLLDSLPRFIRCGGGTATSDGLLDNFIRFAAREANSKRAGSQTVLNRLSELMLVEVIRTHMDQPLCLTS